MFNRAFIKRNSRLQILFVVICVFMLLLALMPTFAHAQVGGGQKPAAGVVCDSWTNFAWNFPTCMGRSVGAYISGLLVWMADWFLTIASAAFNWVISHTVVDFGKWESAFDKTITNVWTAFRDISNILIIGLFVFIAINIILGKTGQGQFGARHMIARVLVVAVLINFSLLFTKMIVDASNYTADQIYQATVASGIVPDDTKAQAGKTVGIAGSFEQFAGVSSFWDTKSNVQQLADRLDSGFVAMLHAIFVMIMFIVAAFVLFYGAFLLIARALLFLFLMMTSSIAFATYLIPSWAGNKRFGWSAWWSTLINNAIFAPLLMLLLWVALAVAQQMKNGNGGQGGSGTLGDVIANPSQPNDISALFTYCMVIAMLFIAIQVAKSFSTKIGGFNVAAAITAAPFTLGTQYGLAPYLRGTRGRNAYEQSKAIGGEISAEAARQATLKNMGLKTDYSKLDNLLKQKAAADAKAKSSFNPFNTAGGKGLATALGLNKAVGGLASGADAKPHGFADSAAVKSAEAAEKARNAALGAATKTLRGDRDLAQKVREGIAKEEAERQAQTADLRGEAPPKAQATPQSVKTAEDALAQARQEIENKAENRVEKESLRMQKEAAQKNVDAAKGSVDQNAIKAFGEQLRQANANARTQEDLRTKANNEFREGRLSQENHRRMLEEQDKHIKEAHTLVKTIQEQLEKVQNPPAVVRAKDELEKVLREERELDIRIERDFKENGKRMAEEIRRASEEAAKHTSANIDRQTQTLAEQTKVVKDVAKTVGDNVGEKTATIIKPAEKGDQFRNKINVASRFRNPGNNPATR